ncbi:DNA translocase FtsK [Ureibacillus sp. MALMAid1270]|uniref:DNA translocase FtsK n=1 Tax=Ureibacillus sp. MALMAid1270 TaxID=3411629 RepID=UPI003BA5580C
MSWFKKKFSRFFYEENNDHEEDIELEEMDIQEETYESNKRRSFRFPIIADDEIEQLKPEPTINNHTQRVEKNYYDPMPSSIVYDVEVSGIRELLEKRRNGKGKSVRKNPVELKQSIKHKPLPNNQANITKKRIEIEIEPQQVESRRRFTPSQVPSPVHGFRKPSPINQLLDKKQELSNSTTIDHNLPIEKNNAIKEAELVQKEIASTDLFTRNREVKDLYETINESVQYKTNYDELTFKHEVHDIQDEKVVNEQVQLVNDQSSLQENMILENRNLTYKEEYQTSQLLVQQLADREISFNEDSQTNQFEIFEEESYGLESIDYDQDYDDFTEDEPFEELQDDYEEHLEEFDDEYYDTEEEFEAQTKLEASNNHNFNNIEEVLVKNDEPTIVSNESILEDNLNKVEDKSSIHHTGIDNEKASSGSKLPFNVIMLKSDKEKLKMKQALQKPVEPIVVTKSVGNVESDHSEISDEIETISENHDEEQITTNYVYEKPAYEYLVPPEEKTEDREWMESQAENLVESLSHFQVTAQVESIVQGPAVTQFEITVGHGTKVSKIKNLADDLKLALAAKDIRIQAPIPGKSSIGIEIPNRISRAVRLSEVVSSDIFTHSESPLEAALGLDLTGKPITIDLRKMPHGLIAGATGSGKSVCINSILVSLLYKADPHELKLMLIDPKVVELAPFNNIPHLVSPVITDVKTATAALKWAVEEMERRYQLFAHVGVRDLSRYNKQAEKNGNKNKLPYILIVIDELADLMMMAPSDVEESIARIAQKARACGIHLIVATQRPSVDVITGLIKSNIPTRIAFAVSSQIDSRTILDSQGAERLLGRGDMLYLGNGMSAPIRIQGTFVTDDEIEEIIEHVRSQGKPSYMFEHEELLKKTETVEEYDELFEEVCRFVYEQGTASTSSIQRKYNIGYNRAARMMDLLEKNGFISEQRGSKPREVYITESDLMSMFD